MEQLNPSRAKIPADLVCEECQEKAGKGEKESEWVFYPSTAPLGAATVEKMENPTWNRVESNSDTMRAPARHGERHSPALPWNIP